MIAVEEILSDGGLGRGETGGGGGGGATGGGGGGGATSGGTETGTGGTPPAMVYLTDKPNTPLSNFSGKLQIKCVIGDILSKTYSGEKIQASIYINEQSSGLVSPSEIKLSARDIFNNGDYNIKVVGNGYKKSVENYVITLIPSPNYNVNDNPVYTAIPFSEEGKTNNLKIIGLSKFEFLPTIDENNPEYGNTNFYEFKIIHYINGIVQPETIAEIDKDITFILEKAGATDDGEDNLGNVQALTVVLTGADGSAQLLIDNADGTAGETVTLNSGVNGITTLIGKIVTIKSNSVGNTISRITEIAVSANGYTSEKLLAVTDTESVSTKITIDKTYVVDIQTETIPVISLDKPSISFVNPDLNRKHNINSEIDAYIGIYKNEFTEGVRVKFANEELTYSNLAAGESALINIPLAKLPTVGKYRIIIIPFTSNGNDGDPIELMLNVVSETYVGVPDIRNINYPTLIKGPDYVGTNVNFKISYESVSTDYVRISVLGSSQHTQATSAGNVTLNYQQLLNSPGAQYTESDGLISLTLKLVPYNEQGNEVVVGKEEFITIQFDKSELTIPRNVVINRLVDGFISQLNTASLVDESSKYLNHLLHLPNDNKLITTWLGSEGSLILKLYEPLSTAIQPNQQVWISKLQSDPIIETINITGENASFCPPLKGPNFSLEENNGVAYQILDDLIASGSITSNDIVNNYLEGTNVNTTKLNLQYVSGSDYTFKSFSHFGSAEERAANFFYKVKLLETYKARYEALIATTFIPPYDGYNGGILTENGFQVITEDGLFDVQWEIAQSSGVNQAGEAKKVLNTINGILRNFDGFENFLYKSNNNLAYPKVLYVHPITGLGTLILRDTTHASVTAWYNVLIDEAANYDKYNPNYLVNNIPEFIREDYNNNDFIVFLDMIGQHFDIVWAYVKALDNNKILEHKQINGLSNTLVSQMLQSFGWNPKNAFNSPFLWEYAFGKTKDGFQKYGMPLSEANDEVWRRILNNLPYLLKHKGTARAMKAIMACYGVPQSMLTIMEFGGPQDPTQGGTSKFTFDDRTAAFYLKGDLNGNGSSNIKVPWHEINSVDYPNCIEFRILPNELPTPVYTLISGSEWTLDLVQTTGSFGKLELNFGGDISNSTYFSESISTPASYYIQYINDEPYAYGPDLKTGSLDFPISTEHYSQVVINRHNSPDSSSWFEVWWGTSDGQRIITSVSMSIQTDDTQWETGSYLQIGGNGFQGNLDEVRLWKVPLQRSKFENHTLFPDAINGNSYTASTADLVFRLDFEKPKDRILDPYIKNVSISEIYGEGSATASNMYSAATYPYQYIPYDRTVTANVPSLGFNYSNKVRFESASLVTDLSYKTRATKKAFDQAPIDTNRLGLFFSPIKELNMDILKAFGDFNIDNYIGNPSDEYRTTYKELDTLRRYYFERLDNRDIYEYIRLVKYIDRSLFDTLIELAPARTNVVKGLLIEPHFLERSKIKWTKPVSERNDFESIIDTKRNITTTSDYLVEEANLDVDNISQLAGELNNYDSVIDIADTSIVGQSIMYNGEILNSIKPELEASAPFFDTKIQCPIGASLVGEADSMTFTEIGMDPNSLANRGFGLYSKNGVSKINYFDNIFGNHTSSRSNVYVVKEQYTQKINTQVKGWPVNGAALNEPVRYEKVPVTLYRYRVSTLPFSGSITIGNDVAEVQTFKGYLPTHYKYVNNLSEGLRRSYFKGSVQNSSTTPDGLSAVETFITNPNILKVAKTGRGSGEPILEVD